MTSPLNLAGIPVTDDATGLMARPWLLYLLGLDAATGTIEGAATAPITTLGDTVSLVDQVAQAAQTLPLIMALREEVATLRTQIAEALVQPVQDKGDLQELTVKTNSIGYASSSLQCPTTIQVTGLNNPASGAGVEAAYTGGQGYVIAYDRTSAAYTPINIGGSTVGLGIGGVTKLSVDTGGNVIGAAEVRAGNSMQALGANVTVTASSSVLDYNAGTRIVGVGPNNSTNATFSILTVRSDASNLITDLSADAAGNITLPQHKAGTPTWVAGDKYLVVNSSGNIHVSAVGPAS